MGKAGTVEDIPVVGSRNRGLPVSAAFGWLAAGARDLTTQAGLSLAYGLVVFLVSIGIVSGLFYLDLDYILFPAIAAFMVVGPLVAVGLYQKSRLLEAGEKVTLARMLFVRPASGPQIMFIGVIMLGLALLWMRAAVIIYALFFGLRPFTGLDNIVPILFGTPLGWSMLVTGTVVGDSYVIREGKLAEPIKPNTLRINENIRNVLNGVIGVSKEGKPTLVWAADEIVYAPEVAVEKVRLDAIGEYMETL